MDPDVRALAGLPAAPAPPVAHGALSVGKFLGVTLDGLGSGRAIQKLGVVAGALLALAFFLPAAQVGHWYRVYDEIAFEWVAKVRWEYKMSWELIDGGPKIALLLPLVLGLLGIAAATVPKLSPALRGGALAVLGLLGWTLGLGPLGAYGWAPTSVINFLFLGVAVTGAASIMRLLDPTWRPARVAVLVGAAIVGLGYLVPLGDLGAALPGEFAQYGRMLDIDLTWSPPLFAMIKAITPRAAPILFVAAFAILPLLVAPVCAGVAWSPPRETWDKMGILLRPLAWFIVLFVPLWYGLMTFNLVGWGAVSTEEALLPRAKLTLLSAIYFLWIQIGAAAVADGWRRSSQRK